MSEARLFVKMHMTAERSKLSLSHVAFEEKNALTVHSLFNRMTHKEENKTSFFFSKDIATYLMMGQVKMCIPKFLLSKNETGLF